MEENIISIGKGEVMKKKVLFLTTQFNHGGVERSLIEVCKALDPSKYDITLFLRNNKTDLIYMLPEYVNVIVNEDGHYYRKVKAIYYKIMKGISKIINKPLWVKKYEDALKQYVYTQKIENPKKKYFADVHFDVVVSYTVHLCTEMALLIDADKHYVVFHSEEADFHKDITDRTFPIYDRIIAVGPGVELLLREAFPQFNDKIIQLCNYIDASKIYELAAEEKKDIEATKNSGKIMFTTSARMVSEKAFDLAVEAARILRDKDIEFEWYFLGDGYERENVEKLIKEYVLEEYIHVMGFQMNPYPYMKNCDIYVHPAHLEAQPLAIMEAIVLGKAIVSTDSLGGKAVLEYGKKGLVVSQDGEAIAEGILKFIAEPDLKKSFEGKYTLDQNRLDKKIYSDSWDMLLN